MCMGCKPRPASIIKKNFNIKYKGKRERLFNSMNKREFYVNHRL